MADDLGDEPVFDPSLRKKKKKKKKKPVEAAPVAEESPAAEEPKEDDVKEDDNEDNNNVNDDNNDDDGDDLSFAGKKKKKSSSNTGSGENSSSNGLPWGDSDREYKYEELLDHIYKILHSNNPELVSNRTRYVMKPPTVYREGTRKTVWSNFAEICKIMKRQPDHVLAYSFAELGTTGSVDGNRRLVIKGRFQPKQIESVIRHYISQYVTCRTCKSPDTQLVKENRLYFMKCNACGSRRSVAAIKTGFVAQVGRRKR